MTLSRFGAFELDHRTGELRQDGRLVRLPAQPARLLRALVSRAGHLVTKEELRREIWGDATFVDFDLGLRYALHRLRGRLGDDAGGGRFIETVRGQGLRFVAPVESRPPRECPTLAVLPFENLAAGSEREYLAAGLADLLTTELARYTQLRLISRQSVRHLAQSLHTAQEIGRELAVDALIEGTVLSEGDRLRINVQLVQVDPERHLWAGTYEGDLEGVLTLQARTARCVAAQVASAFGLTLPTALPGTGVPAPMRREAQVAYLKALVHFGKWSRPELDKAVAYLQEAIAAEPRHAAALAHLSATLGFAAFWGLGPPADLLPRARAAAERALEIDAGLSAAHLATAWCLLFEWDFPAAGASVVHAIELNPSDPDPRLTRVVLSIWGEQERDLALEDLDRALSLDPVSPMTNASVAWGLLFADELDRAMDQARRTLDLHPNVVQAWHVMGWAHAREGRLDEAVAAFEQARTHSPDPLSLAFLAQVLGVAGCVDEARAIAAGLEAAVREGRAPARALAIALAGLGERERALAALEEAFRQRDPSMACLPVGPQYLILSGEPRFEALVAQRPRVGRPLFR